ncbi:metal-dependent hydrolase [Embleya hyalina]|uniref:Metal-dependent hydrolase n=1 Tax=Embleya hyalina TaxID=516124 RepID=A0A401YL15_9ACTN|nr:metal-dependent hydrolase [Embleya hyalina]
MPAIMPVKSDVEYPPPARSGRALSVPSVNVLVVVADPGAGHDMLSGAPYQGAVEVRRSARRKRTVSAYRDGDRTVVLLPGRMTQTEEKRWVGVMLERLAAQERRRRPSDEDLAVRARELSARYLDGRAEPASVRWVGNQNTRWGSCTPVDGTIRLSTRLRGMPTYVVDYVLLHELAHLLVPGHGPRFWTLLAAYPRTERARGYLEGVATASGLAMSDEADTDPADAEPARAGAEPPAPPRGRSAAAGARGARKGTAAADGTRAGTTRDRAARKPRG